MFLSEFVLYTGKGSEIIDSPVFPCESIHPFFPDCSEITYCFSVCWVQVDVSFAPSATHLIKVLPVNELYNNLTNVSKVVHHLFAIL